MLLSQHSDGEILSRVALHLGFGTVRGSTNRGGAAAMRQLIKISRHNNLTITPDGPRVFEWPDPALPNMILDDGGDATLLLHLGARRRDASILIHPGSEEETAICSRP